MEPASGDTYYYNPVTLQARWDVNVVEAEAEDEANAIHTPKIEQFN